MMRRLHDRDHDRRDRDDAERRRGDHRCGPVVPRRGFGFGPVRFMLVAVSHGH
jgi:hypothetical protein